MWWKLLLVPVALYLAVAAIFYFMQTAMLFPAGSVALAGPLPADAQRLTLTTANGDRLAGVLLPATRPGEERITILGFGGNAWNAQAMAGYLRDLVPEADIVAFHYRGYAPSEGNPSAAALRSDAPMVFDLARERLGARRTIAVGFSIGGGAASALAALRPVDGLILVTPFDSLATVAARQFRWLPVRLLFRHDMEPAADLEGRAVPVALIAGERDTLIPPERAEALHAAAGNPVFMEVIPGAGHNDIYDRDDFRAAMREAFARVTAR